jgi:hypothetical protein
MPVTTKKNVKPRGINAHSFRLSGSRAKVIQEIPTNPSSSPMTVTDFHLDFVVPPLPYRIGRALLG